MPLKSGVTRAYRRKEDSQGFALCGRVMVAALGMLLASCSGGGGTAQVSLPTLTVTSASVVEGNAGTSNLVFTVTSSIAATSAIAITYATADGTALAGQDYTATNGTLTIAVGATSGTVTVPVSGDTTIEPDETFTLVLTAPANATIAGGTITGTILNDDFPTLSIADAAILEGSSGGITNLTFTVTLSAAFPSAVTVDYATSDGTALSASDYTNTAATLTIPAGNITGTITVILNADTLFEANETFTITLSNSANATISTAVATGTILNDDVGGLNDTGITLWGDAVSNILAVTQAAFPGQDADHGRDANPATNSNADGKAGFFFTKLDAAGQPLANQAAVYATTPWSCVQDHVTGLWWEVKTTAGAGGLHDANYTYTWFNSTGVNDGGNPGTANGGVCTGSNCDTESYVAAVNAAGLCGYSDWRLPTVGEIYSLADQSVASPGPTIDTGYFPNTIASVYWSSSPYAANATDAWSVFFHVGFGQATPKTSIPHVRLVRGGQ